MLNANSCSTDQYTIPPLLRFDGAIKKQMIATVKRSDISTRAKKVYSYRDDYVVDCTRYRI